MGNSSQRLVSKRLVLPLAESGSPEMVNVMDEPPKIAEEGGWALTGDARSNSNERREMA